MQLRAQIKEQPSSPKVHRQREKKKKKGRKRKSGQGWQSVADGTMTDY
jgi:hypothetical protein